MLNINEETNGFVRFMFQKQIPTKGVEVHES
ncbi:hypothetical protein Desor_0647 [Desulfosporosinus orientis DSM 765]|uniref:Uncharacterized protein n=1 Tax=Desulfosporosinus orientis (strain ATCC 19365 / DSM 765 / NCIMB 8382 / VKM B-1628 / Singapore I) TaxID=768706 RepID=G7W5B2_DESOD|nr:hypothetical protein Desor_0647 [Desulfosporosinus orientis DSM 765]